MELQKIEPNFATFLKDHSSWLKEHPRSHELGKYNEAWASLGFQLWKPHLIKHVLESSALNFGDLLFYHDVNCIKYPEYLMGGANARQLSEYILKKLRCDIFIPEGFLLKHDVKADLIRKYLGENGFDEMGLWVGLVLIRKSEASIKFIKEWVEISSSLDNLSPLPNPAPHPDFVWHAPEQATAAVLGALWRSKKQLPLDWPRYGLRNRAFTAEALMGSRLRSWYRLLKRTRRVI